MNQMPVKEITVEHNPAQSKLDALNVKKWPTWKKEVSIFPWTFPEQEIAFILEGECEVITCCGNKVTFGKGDLVTFPAGVKITWEVKQALHKHYQLDGNIITQTFKRIKAAIKL
jgi:uncharacterized cupin superfamily protein